MSAAPTLRSRPLLLLCLVAFVAPASALPSLAQEKLAFRIDDEVTRFAFSGDGRIAYSTRHVFSEKKIQLQRDDLWIAERDGKKKKILQGEKFVRGNGPFSYLVRGLRWSPDGKKLAVELATSEMINEAGDAREGVSTLLLDENGGEISVGGNSGLISDATNASWLGDNTTLVYLTRTRSAVEKAQVGPPWYVEPPVQDPSKEPTFTTRRMSPSTTPGEMMFGAHHFTAVAWNPVKNSGACLERLPTRVQSEVELYKVDVPSEMLLLLATLHGYVGGLSISPSGEKVAYWINNEQLEVRQIAPPNSAVRLHVLLGTLAWSGDENRVLVKQGSPARSGSLVWAALPKFPSPPPYVIADSGEDIATKDVALQPILHDLEFRQFDISPDGTLLGVVEPGRRNLLVYSLP